jgi:hypothetical protein
MIRTVLKEGRERVSGCRTLIAAAACVLWFAGDMWSAGAQTAPTAEEARMLEFGKEIFKSKAVCQYCHKWDASGDQGYGGNAVSLRATHLTPEQLTEVVKCGRPSTGMPYHDRFAYTDKRCYGYTREEMGKDMPPAGNDFLSQREVGRHRFRTFLPQESPFPPRASNRQPLLHYGLSLEH